MTLMQGDCLELMDSIPSKSIDLILCDLPYGTTACKWDVVIPFEELWKQYNRIIKDRGAVVLFGAEPFSSTLRMSNIKNYKYDWVWDKKKAGNIMLCKYQPMKITENVMIFNKHNYYPIMELRDKVKKSKCYGIGETMGGLLKDNSLKTYTHRYPKNILSFSNANQKGKVHPTQKPTDLLEYLIKTYTNENDLVLDFTMGSGSTGVACANTNRKFIGIELDNNYFNIASKRIEEAFFNAENKEGALNE